MDLVKRSLSKWINAAIVLTVGILVIVMGANTNASADAAEAISMVLGIILIVVSSLALLLAICGGIMAKTGFLISGISSGFSLAIGISLVSGKYAAALIALFLYVIPFLLIVVGIIILADAIFKLVLSIKAKISVVPEIVSIVTGALAMVLGFLCVGNEPVISQGAQLVVFGIILIVYACLMVLGTFFKLPDATVLVVEEKKAE